MVTGRSNRPASKRRPPDSIAAGEWLYQSPFELKRPDHPKRWVCRRRNTRTKKLEMIFLDDASTRGEAKKARAAHAETARGPGIKEGTLREALARWLATLDVRASTASDYQASAKLYERLLGPEREVSGITFPDIEGLFTGRWKEAAGRTKLGHRALLIRFFDWAVDSGYIQANPARKVRIQKAWTKAARKAARETGQGLTLDEARRLLAACREKVVHKIADSTGRRKRGEQSWPAPAHLWWFVFVSLRTGLRVGNVVGTEIKPPLRWGMVDLEAGMLSIEGRWMKNDMDFIVPLHAELISLLRERISSLGRVPAADEAIIPGAALNLRRGFNSALKRAGLGGRGFRIHDLRHAFVSWLGKNCVHSTMQILAGHAPANITDRYAQHQEVETLRAGINSLPRLLTAPGQAETA
jgi:integrase